MGNFLSNDSKKAQEIIDSDESTLTPSKKWEAIKLITGTKSDIPYSDSCINEMYTFIKSNVYNNKEIPVEISTSTSSVLNKDNIKQYFACHLIVNLLKQYELFKPDDKLISFLLSPIKGVNNIWILAEYAMFYRNETWIAFFMKKLEPVNEYVDTSMRTVKEPIIDDFDILHINKSLSYSEVSIMSFLSLDKELDAYSHVIMRLYYHMKAKHIFMTIGVRSYDTINWDMVFIRKLYEYQELSSASQEMTGAWTSLKSTIFGAFDPIKDLIRNMKSLKHDVFNLDTLFYIYNQEKKTLWTTLTLYTEAHGIHHYKILSLMYLNMVTKFFGNKFHTVTSGEIPTPFEEDYEITPGFLDTNPFKYMSVKTIDDFFNIMEIFIEKVNIKSNDPNIAYEAKKQNFVVRCSTLLTLATYDHKDKNEQHYQDAYNNIVEMFSDEQDEEKHKFFNDIYEYTCRLVLKYCWNNEEAFVAMLEIIKISNKDFYDNITNNMIKIFSRSEIVKYHPGFADFIESSKDQDYYFKVLAGTYRLVYLYNATIGNTNINNMFKTATITFTDTTSNYSDIDKFILYTIVCPSVLVKLHNLNKSVI